MDFLEFKPDQVSGVRDRSGAVAAEALLPTFRRALETEKPRLWAQAEAERAKRRELAAAVAVAAAAAADAAVARRTAKASLWSGGGSNACGASSGGTFSFEFRVVDL